MHIAEPSVTAPDRQFRTTWWSRLAKTWPTMFLPPKVLPMLKWKRMHDLQGCIYFLFSLMCTASQHENSFWCALLWTLEKGFKKARTTNTRNMPSSSTNSKRSFNEVRWANRECSSYLDPVAHRPGALWMHRESYTRPKAAQIKPQVEEMTEKWDIRRRIMARTTRERINHIRILIYSYKCFKRT